MKHRFVLLLMVLLRISSVVWAQQTHGPQPRVVNIERMPAIDALLWAAEICDQPLGVIASDKSIISTEVSLRAPDSSCDQVFPRIMTRLPMYESRNLNGVLFLEPINRDAEVDKLFNTVIANFEAGEATTGQLSNLLWMDLQLQLDPTIKGFASIYHSNDHILLPPIRLPGNTVKDVLNEIVRRRTSAAWIGFVPPANLLGVEGDKLWNIVTYENPPVSIEALCCLDKSNFRWK